MSEVSADTLYQYRVERELADRLRGASREERTHLYSAVYDELFQRVPSHPQLSWKADPSQRSAIIENQARLLGPLLGPDAVFLEIGSGDGGLLRRLAPLVRRATGVDVSAEIAGGAELPENAHSVISDGTSIPVTPGTVDVAYSANLMEHLHPDDAVEQVGNVYAALRPGGVYVCVTPHRMSGPHDISADFDEVATGFHLREYTVGDLRGLLRGVGFVDFGVYVGAYGRYLRSPAAPVIGLERALALLPLRPRRALARWAPIRMVLASRVTARKPGGTPAGRRISR